MSEFEHKSASQEPLNPEDRYPTKVFVNSHNALGNSGELLGSGIVLHIQYHRLTPEPHMRDYFEKYGPYDTVVGMYVFPDPEYKDYYQALLDDINNSNKSTLPKVSERLSLLLNEDSTSEDQKAAIIKALSNIDRFYKEKIINP